MNGQMLMKNYLLLFLLLASSVAFAGGGRNRVMGDEMTIPPAAELVTIDGDLGDWDESTAKLFSLNTSGFEDSKSGSPLAVHSARVAFQYDQEALYVAAWFNDPTPLGPQTNAGYTPAGDGLVLDIPIADGIRHVALWREPGGTAPQSRVAGGGVPLSEGAEAKGITQGYRVTGNATYTQEVRIPWNTLGGKLETAKPARLGVQLCFGGLDAAAGYKAWQKDSTSGHSTGNRWGGGMCWGFVDGVKTADVIDPGFDPAKGAEVVMAPAGTRAPENTPVMYDGNERTRTQRMIAVPVSASGVTVDGVINPAEWAEESGTVIAYEPTLFPGQYAVKIFWAYGADGLYAALRWQTAGPHLNINNPELLPRGYDGGDALQMRLGFDRVTHVDAWYYDEGRQYAMVLDYGARFNEGKVGDALAAGAKLALRNRAGGGYDQELFLPWKLITTTGASPAAGSAFQVIFDLFFSGLEGNRIPYIVNARLAFPTGVAAMPYTAPAEGYYSVVIADSAGRTVRRLLTHAKLGKGRVVGDWDGLDDDGQPVPAGEYTFRGLYHGGIGLKYLTSYNNPGQPPWQNDDGTGEWGGDHGAPQTVAADGDGVIVGWPSGEDGDGIIRVDLSGKKQWGFFQTPYASAGGGTALAALDNGTLYFLNEAIVPPQKGETELAYFQSVISALDPATGRYKGFSLKKNFQALAKHNTSQVQVSWYWDLWHKKDFSWDTYAIHDDYYFSGRCAGGNAAGLAARDGKLYVSWRIPGELAVYDASDLSERARWKVEKPGALAFGGDGKLYAVSGVTVGVVDIGSGQFTPLVQENLVAPAALAVGPEGELLVADWGDAQCVKVFAPSGAFIRTIGLPGGRPWQGKYDPHGMLLPRGLAVDKTGQVWVAEDDSYPRRLSVWRLADGAFLREFIGGTTYGATGGGMIDPADGRHAYSDGVWYGIDLAGKEYAPVAVLPRRLARDEYFTEIRGNNGHTQRIVTRDGRRFLVHAAPDRIVLGELTAGYGYKPLAAVGGIFKSGVNPQTQPDNKLRWRDRVAPAFFADHPGENYIWTDLNGDGVAQEQEFQWRKQDPQGGFPCWGAYWGVGQVDAELGVTIGGGDSVARFPLQGFTANGVPQYDINKMEVCARPTDKFASVVIGTGGETLTLSNAGTRNWGNKRPGLYGFDREGRERFYFPTREDPRPMANTKGEGLMGPVDAGKELGEIIGITQWHGLHVPLITTDGIFVARLLRDPAMGGESGPDLYMGETIQCLSRLDDGRIILAHGKNAHHLMQVTGLETAHRFAGAFTLSPEQAASATAMLAGNRAAQGEAAPVTVSLQSEAVTVDGKLDDWDWTAAVKIGAESGTPRAEAALRTDGKKLYAAWKVTKGGGFSNKGDDFARLFLSGDAVDVHFCTDATAPAKRKELHPADCRLLFSRLDDKPGAGEPGRTVAVLYRVATRGPAAPRQFVSPGATVEFEQVVTLDDAQVAITDTEDGYVLEASVPLKAIFGTDDQVMWLGRVFAGDVGVVIGDKTGRRVARLYRFNKNDLIVSDVPTEARLYPAQWGELEVIAPAKGK